MAVDLTMPRNEGRGRQSRAAVQLIEMTRGQHSTAKALYARLWWFDKGDYRGAFPGELRLAEDLGLETRTVRKWRGRLIEDGLVFTLKVLGGGNVRSYFLTDLGIPRDVERFRRDVALTNAEAIERLIETGAMRKRADEQGREVREYVFRGGANRNDRVIE